ncbi:MAG: hypothetical protein HUJ26_03150 [Planctomycetaceae bacterium]|nr:hypothetical protein [Planctomycetaceae bacterium]
MRASETATAATRLGSIIPCVHFCLLAGGFLWGGMTFVEQQAEFRKRPTFRNEPIAIRPVYDDPSVISDETLSQVLWKMRPRFRHPGSKINHIDHALRMWGPYANFRDPESLSGVEMLEILLDERSFRRNQGESAAALLEPGKYGLLVKVQEGSSTSSHVDHTLAGLGEIGIPLDYPIILNDGEFSVSEMLRSALENFSLNQAEYEWSALAFAEYFEPTDGWYSQEGQRITFDNLAQRLMRQRLAQGVCRGNHRLHTLVMFLRIDEVKPLLSPEVRQEVIDHLRDVTDRLMATQSSEGFWSDQWPGTEIEGMTELSEEARLPIQTDRFLVTGHTLEWWALAPSELQPPREVVVRAADWLSSQILKLTPQALEANYTFLTHAGRALAMWRGKLPSDVDLTLAHPRQR